MHLMLITEYTLLPKHYFYSHVEPHDFLCQAQSLHGLALFAAIATIRDQESFATN